LAGTDKPAIKAMIKWHGVLPLAEIADNLFTVIVFKAVQKFRKSSDSFFVSSSSIFILIFRFFPDFFLSAYLTSACNFVNSTGKYLTFTIPSTRHLSK
jgi:hypothetical protein